MRIGYGENQAAREQVFLWGRQVTNSGENYISPSVMRMQCSALATKEGSDVELPKQQRKGRKTLQGQQ